MDKKMSTTFDWDNACRLCSEERAEMFPIFGDEGIQRRVTQKMRACFPVMVYKTDPLPKQICQFCAARLDDAYEFREHCLGVYKMMRAELLRLEQSDTVRIFLDAMKNSPDPCQAQLCREKARAPPPLVPLPASLPPDKHSTSVGAPMEAQENAATETLAELPCEVQIKEEPPDIDASSKPLMTDEFPSVASNESFSAESVKRKRHNSRQHGANKWPKLDESEPGPNQIGNTSILEQVLTGNLTLNDRTDGKTQSSRPSSKWWCVPCNRYYRTNQSLRKHKRLFCPERYKCRKCPSVFQSMEDLAKHEGSRHLKVTLDFAESVNECDKCDREFVSPEVLDNHMRQDHEDRSSSGATNTWCPPSGGVFVHQRDDMVVIPSKEMTTRVEPELPKNPFFESTKSLACPTCGKVCTQQSALSNHMRTHEPKKHKCEVCGRSFGLFVRLAAHKLSEHDQQSTKTAVMSSVEQEEALNAEREAREAIEAGIDTGIHNYQNYVKVSDDEDATMDTSSRSTLTPSGNFNASGAKNVARCGICLQWFSDHTTMLTHLQTHSESYVYKSFGCRICKKTFKEKWQLLRHEMSHKRGNAETYACSTCKKPFNDKAELESHEATHVVNKTFHCNKCNKIFFKEFSMQSHQCSGKSAFAKRSQPAKSSSKASLSASSSKKYKCSKCSAQFTNSQSRNSHMRVHSQAHATMQALKKELKKESEANAMPKLEPESSPQSTSMSPIEPIVKLEIENSPSPVKRTLIRTATGYRCGICQSPFVLRELAVAHLRSAHPAAASRCPHCKKRFPSHRAMTNHVESVHPE